MGNGIPAETSQGMRLEGPAHAGRDLHALLGTCT